MKKHIFCIVLFLLSCTNYLAAQVDTAFWFAVPSLSEHCYLADYHLMFSSYNEDANVRISMPASSSFTPKTFSIAKHSFYDYVLAADYTSAESTFAVPYHVISQRGLLIESDAPISCYFQITMQNGEAYTLKGEKALGTDFVLLMQNRHTNGLASTSVLYTNAYSSLQIVATEDNTAVTINPTANSGSACNKNAINIMLNKGETYALRACDKAGINHIAGTLIHSNKPIAVNSTDDTVRPSSGKSDLVGDQLVPIDYWDTEYIAVSRRNSFEGLYIFTRANTNVTLGDGTVHSLNPGEILFVPLADKDVEWISSTEPIGIYHLTGINEVAGTILPGLHCTGSNEIFYKRQAFSVRMLLHIVIRTSDINSISIDDSPLASSNFHIVNGTGGEWSFANIEVTDLVPLNSSAKIASSSGLFQLGVVDFMRTLDPDNNSVASCTYGYFSDYGTSHEYDEHSTFKEGTTYTWNNHYLPGTTTPMTFTFEGVYRDTLSDSYGCDSICVLHLSLCQILTGDTSATFCNGSSFSWHGIDYLSAGDYPYTYTSKVAPYCDSIVTLHLSQLEPTDSVENVTICEGETHYWHGNPYTSTTNVTETITNAVGCDSICTLHLKVNPKLSGDTSATFCNGHPFKWHGVDYSTAGNYPYTYTSKITGCDSIVTLHLTQLEPTDSIEIVTICAGAPHTWHGQTFTSSTTITETIPNSVGCDSVCTLQLTVLPALTGDTSATFCNGHSFKWHGIDYLSAGDYPYTYTSKITGCDSIVTLHLAQLEPTDSIEVATICAGDTYTWHSKTFTATTTTTETIPNSVGCDSVCTLQLTVLPPIATSINETITEGATYIWNEQTYSENGTYTQSFTTAEGCDSIVTLHLTVNPLIYDILAHIQCADDPFIEFDVTASDGLFHQLQFVFTPKAIAQHFRDTIVDYSASQILIPNSARAGIYDVAVSPLYNSQVLDTRNFQFTLLYPSSVLDQHWDDFIGVLTHNYNGGYDFVGFQWYKNGQPMVGENHSYTYQPLEMGAAYSAMLEEQDGTKLMTCEIIATPQTEISIYPTLLQKQQIIHLHSSKDVTIWLYDNLGRQIYTNTFSLGDHQFAAPQISGIYIIRIQQIGESGKADTRKLIVR